MLRTMKARVNSCEYTNSNSPMIYIRWLLKNILHFPRVNFDSEASDIILWMNFQHEIQDMWFEHFAENPQTLISQSIRHGFEWNLKSVLKLILPYLKIAVKKS